MINNTEQTEQHLLEEEIINLLLTNATYFSSTIYHLEEDYFEELGMQLLFRNIKKHYLEYSSVPSLKELALSFKDAPKQEKEIIRPAIKVVQTASSKNEVAEKMMLQLTEDFIKLAIFRTSIITGADALGNHNQTKMAESYTLAEKAVKVSLTSDFGVGLEDINKVYDEFKEKAGIKLGIPSFDSMIGGGFTRKTLHCIMSASGVGKSAALCSFSVEFLRQKQDVVFITLEMSEAEVSKRIYANLYDIPIKDLPNLDRRVYQTKYNEIKDSIGTLNIKEFPTGTLTPLGLESYLDKLKNEKGITNPIVIVDYLGIMSSDKMKNADNSYSYYGSIAEELRAVAQKKDIIVFTALQLNRSAVNNLEASQAELSESMKIFMTADSAFIIAQTPDMKEKGEMKINYVKNRMSGKTWSFQIGYDYSKFRFDDRFNMGGGNVTTQNLQDTIAGGFGGLKGIMSM